MKILFISSLFISFFFNGLLAKADFFKVGNGGEGVLLSTGLYTRDLYDYNIHLNPWVGPKATESLNAKVAAWNPLDLSISEVELLAAKISDLNKSQKWLGDEILEALHFFTWQFTDNSLVLLEPDEIRTPIQPDQRASIANRFLNSILIHRAYFNQLNEKNKIALLLHEAVYALMNYRKGMETGQSLSGTRLIVAGFFSKEQLESPYFEKLLEGLNIRKSVDLHTSPFLPISQNEKSATLLVSISDKKNPHIWKLDTVLNNRFSKSQNQGSIRNLCRKFFGQRYVAATIRFQHPPVRKINNHQYSARDGRQQYALSISYDLEYNYAYVSTQNECVALISEYSQQEE